MRGFLIGGELDPILLYTKMQSWQLLIGPCEFSNCASKCQIQEGI